ncbi:MAG TPA: FKBP-type peptidyl-prolyl cis-trans isomerase [Polyangia bacterium]
MAAVLLASACKTREATPPAPAQPPAPAKPDAAVAVVRGPDLPPVPKDVAAPPAGAEKSARGVAMVVLQPGKGSTKPAPTDYVEVKYLGWTTTGDLFEGTREESVRLDMAQVISGLADGLSHMVEGEKRRLWIPANLAYAQRLNHVNAPRGDMTYDVELLTVIKPPPVPAELKPPAKDTKKTKSGLVYRVLTPGKGTVRPAADDRAMIRYAMWSAAGKLVGTTYLQTDSTATGPLGRLPAGFREGIQLLTEGASARLWLPAKLAYGEIIPNQEPSPFDPPRGPLVIDVDLVKIMESKISPDSVPRAGQ